MSAVESQVIVYGADWCEDTARARRHLRRLAVAHDYRNIDEDLDALDRAIALGGDTRRTPIVDVAGQSLVEPSNETLTAALVGARLLSDDEAAERMVVQNVGDAERLIRVGGGLALYALTRRAPPSARLPLGLVGLGLVLTGVAGWCPVYYTKGVSSIGGPGDRPTEAERRAWLGGARPLSD